MLKFRNLLIDQSKMSENFDLVDIYPKEVVRKFTNNQTLKKWAGYIDKYVIFKKSLKQILINNIKKYDLIHIIDQSNALYTDLIKSTTRINVLTTCHDLIAIRTALKDIKGAPNVALSGKFLQNKIFTSLQKSDYFCCDSIETKNDLNRLIPNSSTHSSVIYLGTNIDSAERSILRSVSKAKLKILDNPFILHVGNAAWYKNRSAVFKVFKDISRVGKHNLNLVIVGPKPQNHELDDDTAQFLKNNSQNVLFLNNIEDSFIYLLYKKTSAFIFPSFIEGFGWPPIEAFQYGCPIITTKTGAIFEILKDNVIYVDPHDEHQLLKKLILVLNQKVHRSNDITIPTYTKCSENYFRLYRNLIQ